MPTDYINLDSQIFDIIKQNFCEIEYKLFLEIFNSIRGKININLNKTIDNDNLFLATNNYWFSKSLILKIKTNDIVHLNGTFLYQKYSFGDKYIRDKLTSLKNILNDKNILENFCNCAIVTLHELYFLDRNNDAICNLKKIISNTVRLLNVDDMIIHYVLF